MTSMRAKAMFRTALHTVAALALVACAASSPPTPSPGGSDGPAASAPTLKVGDRWVYVGRDGYRIAITWQETHEVTAIGADGITVRVTGKGSTGDFQRTELWAAPGVVRVGAVYESETDRFDPPLIRFKYPLIPGQTWTQSVRNLEQAPGPYGPIQRHVTVDGYESVETLAGTFNALKMRIIMQLDDETFWRYPTQCNYVLWYAPAINGWVKQEQRSYYREKSVQTGGTVPGQYATIELASYTPGR